MPARIRSRSLAGSSIGVRVSTCDGDASRATLQAASSRTQHATRARAAIERSRKAILLNLSTAVERHALAARVPTEVKCPEDSVGADVNPTQRKRCSLLP